jgi:thiamine pyrophosphate-dependent acetolactate synthase large subunit-like protein
MNIQELRTISVNQYNINIIFINSNSLGAIAKFQNDIYVLGILEQKV